MSGMLSQVLLNSGPKGSAVSSNGWYSPSYSGTFQSREAKLPVSLLTYRSGPQYLRAVERGAIPEPGTLADYYSRQLGDNGHEFRMFKTSIKKSWSFGSKTFNNAGYIGLSGVGAQSEVVPSGEAFAMATFNSNPPWVMSDAQLIERGTGYIRDTNPLASEADLLVSLAELLREGIPKQLFQGLLKPGANRRAIIKGFGGDYLSYMFGITPIIRDFDNVYRALQKIDLMIDQWIRDNGAEIRRRRRAKRKTSVESLSVLHREGGPISYRCYQPSSTTGVTVESGSGNPGYGSLMYERNGTSKLETDVSFSSRYSYDLMKLLMLDEDDIDQIKGSNLATRLELTLHALGLHPNDFSLLTVWNLAPFSWLVDWFVNVGDVLSNVRAFQSSGLQMTYGYITAHQIRTVSWDSQSSVQNYDGVTRARAKQGQIYVEKYVRRIRATPFGFGTTFETLSPYRVSILAALASQAL